MSRKRTERILAIDVGTSGVKSGVVDESGTIDGLHRASYPTHVLAGGSFTQEPEDWWRSLLTAAAETLKSAGADGVHAIVLSSQIGTHLLATSDGVPLTGAVTWQDGRSFHDQQAIENQYSRPRIASLVGLNLPSGASWPLARLRWFERKYPAAFSQARYLFQPKEFLLYRLTGAVVGDSSSWRGLVNPATGSALPVLDGLGMADLTVPIKGPTEAAGRLRKAVADELGIAGEVTVFVGWNDLNSSLLGCGAVADGQAFDIGGTSEHIGVVLATSAPVDDRFDGAEPLVMEGPYGGGHGLPRVVRYGVSSNGGSVVEWCASLAPQERDIEHIASIAPPGSNGLLFLPYIVGERAPVWDPGARGAFVGITMRSGLQELFRAALEGVAFNLRQIMELVESGLPRSDSPVLTSGGPARMRLWNQIKADVFRRPIAVPKEPEVGILGAAMIGAVGLGWHRNLSAAARAMRPEVSHVYPDPRSSATYEELFTAFRQLYPALQGLSAEPERRDAGSGK